MRRCIAKTHDTGNFSSTHIEISPDNNLLATASKMGVVNIFKFDKNTKKVEEEPLKSIMNLTTAITDIKFNATS